MATECSGGSCRADNNQLITAPLSPAPVTPGRGSLDIRAVAYSEVTTSGSVGVPPVGDTGLAGDGSVCVRLVDDSVLAGDGARHPRLGRLRARRGRLGRHPRDGQPGASWRGLVDTREAAPLAVCGARSPSAFGGIADVAMAAKGLVGVGMMVNAGPQGRGRPPPPTRNSPDTAPVDTRAKANWGVSRTARFLDCRSYPRAGAAPPAPPRPARLPNVPSCGSLPEYRRYAYPVRHSDHKM